jgi:hypothetical protein
MMIRKCQGELLLPGVVRFSGNPAKFPGLTFPLPLQSPLYPCGYYGQIPLFGVPLLLISHNTGNPLPGLSREPLFHSGASFKVPDLSELNCWGRWNGFEQGYRFLLDKNPDRVNPHCSANRNIHQSYHGKYQG